MDYRELLEKYNLLLKENSRLIRENDRLKEQLGITNLIYCSNHADTDDFL